MIDLNAALRTTCGCSRTNQLCRCEAISTAFDHAIKIGWRTGQPVERVAEIAEGSVDAVIGKEQPAADRVAALGEARRPRCKIQPAAVASHHNIVTQALRLRDLGGREPRSGNQNDREIQLIEFR